MVPGARGGMGLCPAPPALGIASEAAASSARRPCAAPERRGLGWDIIASLKGILWHTRKLWQPTPWITLACCVGSPRSIP